MAAQLPPKCPYGPPQAKDHDWFNPGVANFSVSKYIQALQAIRSQLQLLSFAIVT